MLSDVWISQFVVAHRYPLATSFFGNVTYAGDTLFLTIAVVAVTVFLFLIRSKFALPLFLSSLGSSLTVMALKTFFAEPRPDLLALVGVDTTSFPSGHAAGSIVFYGFCIYVVWKTKNLERFRVLITIALAALILAVGFSRLYLGVHYPTDIVAGYFVGLMWVWFGIFISRAK